MYSIAWPDFISNTNTKIIEDKDATLSNLKLLLYSSKDALFGDPYFGTNIRKLTFNQNDKVLRDLVIDDIYTAILTFLPQLLVNRRDITLTTDKHCIYMNIKVLNKLDYTTNLYNINLTESEVI